MAVVLCCLRSGGCLGYLMEGHQSGDPLLIFFAFRYCGEYF